MQSRVVFSHNSDEWATPQALFDQLDAEFAFNLDPCATAENAKCARFFTKDDDGLVQRWGGQQFSAILRIRRLLNGLRKHGMNRAMMTPLWSY